jgi:8-oxo-dGTP pyrophosphatase MutT (NUDIX family)
MYEPIRGDRGNVLIALKSETRIVTVIEWWQKAPWYEKLPGGGIEEGETIEEAGSRELWEETGIDFPAKKLKFLAKTESRSKWDASKVFTRNLVGANVSESVIDSCKRIGPTEGEFVRTPPLAILNTPRFYHPHYWFLAKTLLKAA